MDADNGVARFIDETVSRYGKNQPALLNILREVQLKYHCISDFSIKCISKETSMDSVEIEETASFYHFFSRIPLGKFPVYIDDSPAAFMSGREEIAETFKHETGADFNEISPDGLFSIHSAASIGMCDQQPAALINYVPFVSLTPADVKKIVTSLKNGKDIYDLVGNRDSHPLIKANVKNNIRKKGNIIFSEYENGDAVRKITGIKPDEVIKIVKNSNLRGRGGAGYPTGMKWEFSRDATGKKRYVICNADEGEPGTFKDRVLLTELPGMIIDGMTTAAYATGSPEGIIYLRAEYEYLRSYLENILSERRKTGLLGKNILGKKGFDFDVNITPGAGAYICGEETSLIESAEGKRGEPRNRPPFPAQNGYLDSPTIINNVETFCNVSQIVTKGAEWFKQFGTVQSSGTKLLSVSGDCEYPGIYEVDFGVTLKELIDQAGADNIQAVIIGGASGNIVNYTDFNKRICYEELSTGGSIIFINQERDLLGIVYQLMRFFVNESCGYCVPCRVGTLLLQNKLRKILDGRGTTSDISELTSWSEIVKTTSRCGLGQTSPNPIISTLTNFPGMYLSRLKLGKEFIPDTFDMKKAVKTCCDFVHRTPVLEDFDL